jgi:hypothetical protein
LFHAFYLVPLNHVGFMAQFMSAIMSKQPQGLAISVSCGSCDGLDAVCVESEGRGCCISVANVPDSIEIARVGSSCFHTEGAHGLANGQRILFVGDNIPARIEKHSAYIAVVATGAHDYFQVSLEGADAVVEVPDVEQCTFCAVRLKRGHSPLDVAGQLPACQQHLSLEDRLGVALRISANDMGFFAFAVKLADQLMISGTFSMRYQCWVPFVGDGAVEWRSFHNNSFPLSLPPEVQQHGLPDSLLAALRDHRKHVSLHKALQKRSDDVVHHRD